MLIIKHTNLSLIESLNNIESVKEEISVSNKHMKTLKSSFYKELSSLFMANHFPHKKSHLLSQFIILRL